MIPGVNSYLCTKILQTPALVHMEQTDKKTLQLHFEEPLQHTQKAGIKIAGVFHMHIYNLTNSERKNPPKKNPNSLDTRKVDKIFTQCWSLNTN